MARRHFSNSYRSPYFQSIYYKNETPGGRFEKKIEKTAQKIKLLFFKKMLRKKV